MIEIKPTICILSHQVAEEIHCPLHLVQGLIQEGNDLETHLLKSLLGMVKVKLHCRKDLPVTPVKCISNYQRYFVSGFVNIKL